MLKHPSVDWKLHGEKVMNYIEIQPRMYCDLKITTAPIRLVGLDYFAYLLSISYVIVRLTLLHM